MPNLKAEETRGRIVAAAQALFAARGFDGATTASIAAAAGVAEKTLFKHFPSKRELLVDSVYPALLSLLQLPALRAEGVPIRQVLKAVVEDRLRFACGNPDLFRLLVQELVLRDSFRDTLLERWRTAIYPALEALLKAAERRGELRSVPPAALVRALVGATVAQACMAVIFAPQASMDIEATAQEIVETLLAGVARSQASAQE